MNILSLIAFPWLSDCFSSTIRLILLSLHRFSITPFFNFSLTPKVKQFVYELAFNTLKCKYICLQIPGHLSLVVSVSELSICLWIIYISMNGPFFHDLSWFFSELCVYLWFVHLSLRCPFIQKLFICLLIVWIVHLSLNCLNCPFVSEMSLCLSIFCFTLIVHKYALDTRHKCSKYGHSISQNAHELDFD